MYLTAKDNLWYFIAYDDVKVIPSCENFPNVPLIGTKGGINYNSRLALRQLGYPLLYKPDLEHVEEFVLYEGVENPELLKKIFKAWREVRLQGRHELGKRNYITKKAYTQWVKDRVEETILPFSSEPSMNVQKHVLKLIPTSKVGKLKDTIKSL